MTRARIAASLLGVALAATLLLPGGSAQDGPIKKIQPPDKQPKGVKPLAPPDEIIQEFPAGGDMQTAWKVHYIAHERTNPGPGLTIVGAWLKTSPKADWLKVIGSIRLSEIYVPYNNGTQIHDIGAQGQYGLLEHSQADAGAHGKLLNNNRVIKELRDTGVLWKYYKQVRRGQELVLWSTLSAGNYNYIMEYSFRCDGQVMARLGSTGQNFGNHETIGHMHHGCWRIDVDLGDPTKNTVYLVRRVESKGKDKEQGKDVAALFNGGVEGGADWNAREFTRLRVDSTLKNEAGKTVSYELWPHARTGSPRHWGRGDEFTHHDYWVTPHDVREQYYGRVHQFAAQKRKISNANVVLWYLSPAYHLPRDEDGLFTGPGGRIQVRGVAMTTWCGFELRPRNVFDKSPLYP